MGEKWGENEESALKGSGEGGGVERTWKWPEWGGDGRAHVTCHHIPEVEPRAYLKFKCNGVSCIIQFNAAGPEAVEKAAAQIQQRSVTSFGNPWEISEPSRVVVSHFGHPLSAGPLLRAEGSSS